LPNVVDTANNVLVDAQLSFQNFFKNKKKTENIRWILERKEITNEKKKKRWRRRKEGEDDKDGKGEEDKVREEEEEDKDR
jgi:hypothetical protein